MTGKIIVIIIYIYISVRKTRSMLSEKHVAYLQPNKLIKSIYMLHIIFN